MDWRFIVLRNKIYGIINKCIKHFKFIKTKLEWKTKIKIIVITKVILFRLVLASICTFNLLLMSNRWLYQAICSSNSCGDVKICWIFQKAHLEKTGCIYNYMSSKIMGNITQSSTAIDLNQHSAPFLNHPIVKKIRIFTNQTKTLSVSHCSMLLLLQCLGLPPSGILLW